MKVAVPAETIPGELRVALTPETARQLVAAGLVVDVEAGAGTGSMTPDAAYRESGAQVVADVDPGEVDVLLHVRPLAPRVISQFRPGTITLGLCSPSTEPDAVRALRDARVTAFAMELVPRLSRAQAMDALTSQALVAGYRSVLEAATRLPRFFPLAMTAAGTVPPAHVLVLGAGVAGLQAIATAKRLGAVVTAYDVRPSSAEEIVSVGGRYLELGLPPIEGPGGYARELDQERAARQQERLTPHVAAADVLITTASIPGRRAPVLVTRKMLEGMRPGSVVVDLAAETGGNVEGSVAGREEALTLPDGSGEVTVVGTKDAASAVPVDASRLYAANVAHLLLMMTKDGEVVPDLADEVVAGACLTHDGVVRHAPTAALLGDPPPPAPEPRPVVGGEVEA